MKRFVKEIIILAIQLFMFYIFPMPIWNSDPMGMVFLIICVTLLLSVIMASISKEKIKYLYPIIVSILFIPSIFIYYNETAFVHSLWYLVVSSVGIILGTIVEKTSDKKKN